MPILHCTLPAPQVTRDQVAQGQSVRVVEAYAAPGGGQGAWSGRAFDQAKGTEWKVVQREQVGELAPCAPFIPSFF